MGPLLYSQRRGIYLTTNLLIPPLFLPTIHYSSSYCYHMASVTTTKASATIFSELQPLKPAPKRDYAATVVVPQVKSSSSSIVLQPRLATLRSYGSDRSGVGVIRKRRGGEDGDDRRDDVSNFFASLSEYVENSRKTRDFEIISGRLAMVVFAATVSREMITGDSLFQKMDLQGIAEATGVCLGAVVCAATFAWFSSARTKVGRIFTVKCNSFIDSLIDDLIDGLFFESELSDWTDDI